MSTRTITWILRAALACAAVTAVTLPARPVAAQADPLAAARDHYRTGKKAYEQGRYQDAINEFTQADQLSPSGLNDYNIAECYVKLGDEPNALAHYQSYLTRVPDAPDRAATEQKIAKLQDDVKKAEAAAAAKKAADDAAAKAAADAAAAKAAADAAAAKAAADAAAAKAAGGPGATGPAVGVGATGPTVGVGNGAPVVAPAPPANTGDAELDKVAAIDVNAIRDQRHLGAGPAVPAGAGGPGGPGTGAIGTGAGGAAGGPAIGATGTPGAGARGGAVAGGPSQPGAPHEPEQPKAEPAYKKWWFWAIIGVGVIVAWNVLSSSPQSSTTARLADMPPPPTGPEVGGVPVLHF